MPVKLDEMLGQPIDSFHKNPESQRKLLSDPKNPPYRAQIELGPEILELLVIQIDANGAVEAIKQVSEVIDQINDISNTIAGAVEEQTATTNEISRNVADAAQGRSDIARNITAVAQAAASTMDGASNTQQAATDLSRIAAELQALVSQFSYQRRGERPGAELGTFVAQDAFVN